MRAMALGTAAIIIYMEMCEIVAVLAKEPVASNLRSTTPCLYWQRKTPAPFHQRAGKSYSLRMVVFTGTKSAPIRSTESSQLPQRWWHARCPDSPVKMYLLNA
jgi:hypothetical protein